MTDKDPTMTLLMWLSDQFKRDPDVAIACRAVCEKYGAPDLGHLAADHRDVFLELVDAVDSMVEELPSFGYSYGMAVGGAAGGLADV